MRTYLRRLIFILFLSCLFPTGATATTFGSVSISFSDIEWWQQNGQWFDMSFSDDDIINGIDNPVGEGSCFPGPAFDPFFHEYLTPNSAGSTFVINQNNFEFWDNMVNSVLSDGEQDIIALRFGMCDGLQSFNWDFSPEYAGNGIDFQGYIIDNLLLTIDDLQVQSFGPDNYFWTTNLTLAVNAQPAPVPEPATMFLLCIGMAGLVGVRIRKKE